MSNIVEVNSKNVQYSAEEITSQYVYQTTSCEVGADGKVTVTPSEKKLEFKLDQHNTGYLPMRGNTLRTSTVQTGTKANLNEAFFVKREMAPDHPDVLSGRRFRGLNRWPDLPGNTAEWLALRRDVAQAVFQ